MPVKVKLADIIDGLESQSYDNRVFVNQKTGKIVHILNEFLGMADDGEEIGEISEWQQEELEIAYDIIENEDQYLKLPDQFEVNEYEMMERFCYTIEDKNKEASLLHSIRGRGAFRRLKIWYTNWICQTSGIIIVMKLIK